jgi:hypothetical protein
LKTETISIKGHEYHSAQSSYQPHDLTYQSFCKTHVSHDNNALSSIAETNSRGLDAFMIGRAWPNFQLEDKEAVTLGMHALSVAISCWLRAQVMRVDSFL